jgi:parallel beta-helix repeat protein
LIVAIALAVALGSASGRALSRSQAAATRSRRILLDHGNRNEFSHNRLSNDADGIVVSGDGNTVSGNWLSGPVTARSAASASRSRAGPAT